MSEQLSIRFADDLPAMTVDVITPDLQVAARLMLTPGSQTTVAVASPDAFLRVHHPSGQAITLADPGNLLREITPDLLGGPPPAPDPVILGQADDADLLDELIEPLARRKSSPSPAFHRLVIHGLEKLATTLSQYISLPGIGGRPTPKPAPAPRTAPPPAPEPETGSAPAPPPPAGHLRVTLDGEVTEGSLPLHDEVRHQWQPLPASPPGTLDLNLDAGSRLTLRLPAPTREVRVLAAGDVTHINLRTSDGVADTLLNYLRRGDVTAASAMQTWAESSHEMLAHKMSDPYAATVGAYLLLRLHRFDLLHDWARNLADRFDYLPDGCVIWAWQLMRQQPDRRDEIVRYLNLAVDRGVPVYTPGLRLALDGLRLVGEDGRVALTELQTRVGTVLWESPLSASVTTAGDDAPMLYEIGFETD